jgi:tricarballylate dehydrogenase
MSERWDVVVIGAGNAGMSAAHAAREDGARVLVLEKAPREWAGGNSYFTAGAVRCVHDGLDTVHELVDDLDEERAARTDLEPYTADHYRADMERITLGRCDPEMTEILVEDSGDAVRWLHGKGMPYRLMWDRQSFEVDGRWRFFGGLAIGMADGGKGLVAAHIRAAERDGIELRCDAPVVGLVQDAHGAVTGVRVRRGSTVEQIDARGVVLAAGGFEADPQMRAAHLGPNWDIAKVRGTPYNTGEVLRGALEAGADTYGHWSGCHSIQWDAGAPATGDLELTNLLSRQSYPIGIVVNSAGERFLDEGADFRNYTYAKYGAEVLRQPGAVAHQIFDARTRDLLRQDEYTSPGISRVEASTIGELAEGLGIDRAGLERTVAAFNAAVTDAPFNPAVKDGKRTVGLSPDKSNWAVPIDAPPYLGFPVTCGVTFTFGGVRIDRDARVLDRTARAIPRLYAAGELVGGLFFHNYPGGSGLAAGAVFGRRAGRSAARGARA